MILTLANNLVFALINRGELKSAEIGLKRIEKRSLTAREKSVIKATRGLFEYRSGSLERGRQLYLDARNAAQKHGAANLPGSSYGVSRYRRNRDRSRWTPEVSIHGDWTLETTETGAARFECWNVGLPILFSGERAKVDT